MTDDRKDGERKVPSWQLPEKRQPETDAYHIWTPRPLLRSIYWKPDPPPPPDVVSSTYEVFIDQRAWLTMHEHVWQTPAGKTPFGYLVGDLCEDPNANRRFINITAALPARFDFREDEKEQISREATLALQLEVERRRGVLAGWYHRHLGGPVEMSEPDVETHHKHFTEPWQCAFVFVARRDGCEGGCFRTSPEEFAGDLHLPFYEMASNESLLARGVKRSYVDWDNYTTVDEIRSEPPPRPPLEFPREPDEGADDEELQLEPFDADPEEMEADEDRESEAAEAEARQPPETPESAEVQESGGEAEDGEEAPIDLDAAMEGVRPARIELDLEDEPEGDAAIEDEPEEFAAEAAPEPEAKPEEPAAIAAEESSWIHRLRSDRRQVAAIVAGVLLLVAAATAGFFLLRGDDVSTAGRDVPVAVESEAGAGAAEDVTGGAIVGADSLEVAGVTEAQVDSAGQEMLQAISRFYGRAVARDRGEATCQELAAAYVTVEDAWIRYNTEFKAEFEGPLPDRLAQRDERLYEGVQDAEREFDLSGCPRP